MRQSAIGAPPPGIQQTNSQEIRWLFEAILDLQNASHENNEVIGPSNATDGNLALFDGTTGKLIKDGGAKSQFQSADATLTALAALDSTVGLVTQTGADAFTKRSLAGTANKITVTDPDGVSGNPTLTIPDAVTLVTPTITGLLTLSGGQIAFPGTQSASSDPNTLDDYEEGTFTPTIVGSTSAGTGTYTQQIGKYTKIGRVVHVDIVIQWTAHSGTGNILIDGLPFTVAANTSPPCSINGLDLTFSNQLTASFSGSSTQARPLTHSSGGSLSFVPMDTSAGIRLAGVYFT